MRRIVAAAFLLASLGLSACQTQAPPPPVAFEPEPEPEPAAGWRAVALAEDEERIDRLPLAWQEALGEARSAGFGRRIAAEGPLLDPGAALPRAAPPPGPYRCRLIRFGAGRPVTAYQPYFCLVDVEGEQLSLTKQEGSERPGGYPWEESGRRLVFLGAVAFRGEPLPPGYGEDRDRSLVGVVERIGPFHYRLVMPWPPSGAALDILELVPFVPETE